MSTGGNEEGYEIVEGEGEEERKKPSPSQNFPQIHAAVEAYAKLLNNPPKRKFNLSYFNDKRKHYIVRRKALDALISALNNEEVDENIIMPLDERGYISSKKAYEAHKEIKKILNATDFAKLSRFEKLKIALLRFSSDERKIKIHRLLSRKIKEDELLKKAAKIVKAKEDKLLKETTTLGQEANAIDETALKAATKAVKELEAAQDISRILTAFSSNGEIVSLRAAARMACGKYGKEKKANKNIVEYRQSILGLCFPTTIQKIKKSIIPSEKIKKELTENFEFLGEEYIELQEIFNILIKRANTYGVGTERFEKEITGLPQQYQPIEDSVASDPTAMVGDFFIAYANLNVLKLENRDDYAFKIVRAYFEEEQNKNTELDYISQAIVDLTAIMDHYYTTQRDFSKYIDTEPGIVLGLVKGLDAIMQNGKKNLKSCLEHYQGSEKEKREMLQKFEKFQKKYIKFRKLFKIEGEEDIAEDETAPSKPSFFHSFKKKPREKLAEKSAIDSSQPDRSGSTKDPKHS